MKYLNNRSVGIGLRQDHHNVILENLNEIDFVEIHLENYRFLNINLLHKIREKTHITIHGLSLSLGGYDDLDINLIKYAKKLKDELDASIFSEHLAWNRLNGQYLIDLIPFKLTNDALSHFCSRVNMVQDIIKEEILIENPSLYLNFIDNELSEVDFLNSISQKTGAGILLDINNLYVNHLNHKVDISSYLDSIDSKSIKQIHLAGHVTELIPPFNDNESELEITIDTHSKPICDSVWNWYEYYVKNHGSKPTLIEWDNDIPDIHTLISEATKAKQFQHMNIIK